MCPPLIPGRETTPNAPLGVAIVCDGEACRDLLAILDSDHQSRLGITILAVVDVHPKAPGLNHAREMGLFATPHIQDLAGLQGLNLIVEFTGAPEVVAAISRIKPPDVSLMDHVAARLFWDLTRIERERAALEKAQQNYLNQTKRQTQRILDSLPYRIMVVNPDLSVEAVNKTFLKEFGLTADAVRGRHCYEVRYGLTKPCKETGNTCYLEDRLQDIQEKGFFSTIREYVGGSGAPRFDVITIAPILDENGQVVQMVEASRDVTERIRLEKEVQKSNIFFQKVIQSTVDGIVVVDTKGNVLIFNEGMENLTGYTRKEIIEEGHLSTFYDIDVAKENMRKMRSNQYGPVGKLNPTSMSIMTKNGEEIPVTLSASIIEIDGKEVGSVGVFTDMREVLQMRKELEQAHLQLVQSEKIASVGRMAAGVAHEINNPLSGVLLYAELLKESLKENPEHLSDLNEIIHQTLRCKQIVSQLLEFSRHTIGQRSSFSLDHLIRQCLNLLIHQALFQDIEVRISIEPDLPEMEGDMGQLQQVFTNLFINAAHAMEGRGTLDIKARYLADRSRFLITVSDTGPGIPAELRDKIFDIFFTTKPVGKGTGLGLSITQNIIHLHGGTITFECPPEGGTTFIIELPAEYIETPTEQPVFVGMEEK